MNIMTDPMLTPRQMAAWVGIITECLPESSLVQIRYQYFDETYRVDIESCGEQAHFFISADPSEWRIKWLKSCIDAALIDIWSPTLGVSA
jgi:hypothetical protein